MLKKNKAQIKKIVEKFLNLLAIQGKAKIEDRDQTILIQIDTHDPNLLIGWQGETLASLEHLLRLIILPRAECERLALDICGYRENQERQLQEEAVKTARKVAREGQAETLGAMNSYQRRLVHTALAEIDGVSTESVGEGRDRRIVIKPV